MRPSTCTLLRRPISREKNPQAGLGYWRDRRPDCKQLLVGLVPDREGFPKAHEVFDGKAQDRSTVGQMLEALEKRTGKRVATVIVDRGMACRENLEEIRRRGCHYMVAGRQPQRNEWLDALESEEGWEQVIRRPSPRDRFKERYPKVARYYAIEPDTEDRTLVRREDAGRKESAKKLDGSYVLKTDRQDQTADEIWRTYIVLTPVEDALRDIKSPLEERPIYHQLEHGVQTHIFLCLLAYHLLVAMEHYFLQQDMHTSWVTVVLPTESGAVLRIRQGTTPAPVHREIYDTPQVPLQVVKPVKTWTRAGES